MRFKKQAVSVFIFGETLSRIRKKSNNGYTTPWWAHPKSNQKVFYTKKKTNKPQLEDRRVDSHNGFNVIYWSLCPWHVLELLNTSSSPEVVPSICVIHSFFLMTLWIHPCPQCVNVSVNSYCGCDTEHVSGHRSAINTIPQHHCGGWIDKSKSRSRSRAKSLLAAVTRIWQ